MKIELKELDGRFTISDGEVFAECKISPELRGMLCGKTVKMGINDIYAIRLQLEDLLNKMAFLEFYAMGIDTKRAMLQSGWSDSEEDGFVVQAKVVDDDGKMVSVAVIRRTSVTCYYRNLDESFCMKTMSVKDFWKEVGLAGWKTVLA